MLNNGSINRPGFSRSWDGMVTLETDRCHYYSWGLCAVLSHFSYVRLFVTQWTTACQAPLSMGFSRQEYWSRLLCPLPGDLPDAGIKLMSPAAATLQADSLLLSNWGSPLGAIDNTQRRETLKMGRAQVNLHGCHLLVGKSQPLLELAASTGQWAWFSVPPPWCLHRWKG